MFITPSEPAGLRVVCAKGLRSLRAQTARPGEGGTFVSNVNSARHDSLMRSVADGVK